MSDARAETIKYHQDYYSRHQLFDSNSWLATPDGAMIELVEKEAAYFSGRAPLEILDLGAGVGRNSVPLAQLLQKLGIEARITCGDVLPQSVQMLKDNATRYGVADYIDAIVLDNDNSVIQKGRYDLILAISVIEHCLALERVEELLAQLASGLKPGGFCQIEITTDRKIRDIESGEELETSVETPMQAEQVENLLRKYFAACKIERLNRFQYLEDFEKNGRMVHWSSTQTGFLARL